ncbi:reverse transcriptase domain-containing protein [Tanacetum coccineum]
MQIVQGRQNQGYAGSGARSNATGTWVNKNGGTNIAGQAKIIRCYNCQEEGHIARQCTKPKRLRNSAWFKEKVMLVEEIPTPVASQTDDLDAFDSDCDEALSANNHVIDQNVQETQYSKQPVFNNDTDIDITSDSNMISYEQYLKETKNIVVQDTSSFTQEEAMIMSVIEEMNNQVAKCNEVIVGKNAKVTEFENQIHSLKLQLNATVESHKTLSTTVVVLKMESKAKDDKYLEEIIELEKKKKALDNVVYKMGQSTQTMHMLTKPQVFYDECHKTTLGYQNPLYLTQAQRNVLALYCGHIIVNQHDALSIIDTEETLELAEESRLKMHAKQNGLIVKEKKVNIAPIDYVALNKLSKHFVKHFVSQKQLFAEEAFWLPILKPFFEKPPVQPEPVLKEIPRELPITNLVHTAVNSIAEIIDYQSMEKIFLDEYSECVQLKAKLSKKNDMVEQENADILREIVEQARESRPLDSDLDFASKFATRIYELLVYVKDTCPSSSKQSKKLIAVTPTNKNKKVRFIEPSTSSSNTQKQVDSCKSRNFTIDGNTFPLTRITSTTVVPPKKPLSSIVVKKTPPSINNSGKLKDITNVVQIILLYLDSGCSKHIKGQRSQLINFVSKFIGKSKKHTHKPKSDDSIQKKLYFLHKDFYGPMRIKSINRKKYILVIVDDYSRFTLSVLSLVPVAAAPRPTDPTGTPLLTSIKQDAPVASNLSTTQETQSPVISKGVEE